MVRKYKDNSYYPDEEYMLDVPMKDNNANLILYMEYRLRQLEKIELLGFFKLWSAVTGYTTVKDYYRYSPKQAFYANILKALEQLPERYMRVVLAIYVDARKQCAVAKCLGTSGSYVSTVLGKALALLRGYKLFNYFLDESCIEVKVEDRIVLPSSLEQLQKLDLQYLDLPAGMEMSLRRGGVSSVGELSARTLADILSFRNIGIVSAEHILAKIVELYARVGIDYKCCAGNQRTLGIFRAKDIKRLKALYCAE